MEVWRYQGQSQAYSDDEDTAEDSSRHDEDAATEENEKKEFAAFWHGSLPEHLLRRNLH